MSRLSRRERSVAFKWKKYEKAKADASALYEKADTLLTEIAKLMAKRGAKLVPVTAPKSGKTTYRLVTRIGEDGRELHLIDKTAGDALILDWGHAAVRRYEPLVVNP